MILLNNKLLMMNLLYCQTHQKFQLSMTSLFLIYSIFAFIFFTLVQTSNNTQTISSIEYPCQFVVTAQMNNSKFLYCSTETDSRQENWNICKARCCPELQSGYTDVSAEYVNRCALAKNTTNYFGIAKILIYGAICLIALSTTSCVFIVIYRIIKGICMARIQLQRQQHQPIQWTNEQHNLSKQLSKIIWCQNVSKASQFSLRESTCSICLEDIPNCQLFCKHYYHHKCIGQWLKKSNFCPLCHQSNIISTKIHCPSCMNKYLLCKKKLLVDSYDRFPQKCQACEKSLHQDYLMKIEELQIPVANTFIFDVSSEVILQSD